MYKEKIDMTRLPQHIAIIMDGNGRWAKLHGKKRSDGHFAGAQALFDTMVAACNLGIKYTTVYAFSTENWNRPDEEVEGLMSLLFAKLDINVFMDNDVRFCVIGNTSRLPQDVQERMNYCLEQSANNKRGTLTVALSYSSKWEIIEATKKIARRVKEGTLRVEDIDDKTIDASLNTSFLPDPDLLIRTGGELRLSNYLLWQCAYTELYFCDTFWPDFNEEELCKAIYDYQQRERRFGKTSEQVTVDAGQQDSKQE
ncbi:MAG: di-trans,poly-cis-decaprenylcistransferase [Bacteroidaceae bacterium]|nr:di-trans,poly-cis-decaprenylcistransferase [Bacteroidaceae bacterium]